METWEKAAYLLALTVVLLIAATFGGWWWSESTPFRPRNVPEHAFFLRAPATSSPGPPRGQWVWCWEKEGNNFCAISRKDGVAMFVGEFVAYSGKGPIAEDRLRISTRTSKEEAVWSGETWVPLVYLEDGEVLIPAFDYDNEKQILDKKRARPR